VRGELGSGAVASRRQLFGDPCSHFVLRHHARHNRDLDKVIHRELRKISLDA
jgi:hypothetical protein